MLSPADYEAWYHTPRGRWIGAVELRLVRQLLCATPGASVLDVGCGSGYFSRGLHAGGYQVTGLDPDATMLAYARAQNVNVEYLRGSALTLPFPDRCFDYTVAITSLCFIEPPQLALREMLRVSRYGVVLGLLNRHSVLHRRKYGRGAYVGARWDSPENVRHWWHATAPQTQLRLRSAVFLPGGGWVARVVEQVLPQRLLCGGFLAAHIRTVPTVR